MFNRKERPSDKQRIKYRLYAPGPAGPRSRRSGARTARGSERDKNSINVNGGDAISLIKYGTNQIQLESLSRSLPRAVLYHASVGFSRPKNWLFRAQLPGLCVREEKNPNKVGTLNAVKSRHF